jgi:hypothetical protein
MPSPVILDENHVAPCMLNQLADAHEESNVFIASQQQSVMEQSTKVGRRSHCLALLALQSWELI